MKSDIIDDAKLDKYFLITKKAFGLAKDSKNRTKLVDEREDYLDMAFRYISDAAHFRKKNDYVNAFAAINYAHGWLDAGARIGLFDVHDSKLFTVE